MNNMMRITLFAMGCLLSVSACCRRDCVAKPSLRTEAEFAMEISRVLQRQTLGAMSFDFERIHQCETRGFLLAQARALAGDEHPVVPLYCRLSIREARSPSGMRLFALDVWGFGKKRAWQDLTRIWLILETKDENIGTYETFASSLENLAWGFECEVGGGGCSRASYLLNSPQMGLADDDVSWFRNVSNGQSKLYFLLDDGRDCLPNKMSRVVYSDVLWNRRLSRWRSRGVLVELMPLTSLEMECMFECH